MVTRMLTEDLRRLGLSEDEVDESLKNMGMLTEEDEEDDEEFDDMEDDELDDEELDDDEIEEAVRRMRTKKSTAKEKRMARQYYKSNKMKIAKRGARLRKKTSWKRKQAALARAPKGGMRVRRVFSDKEEEGHNVSESLLGQISELAESLNREPERRFDQFVAGFNYIADLGELIEMKSLNEDYDEDDLAEDAAYLTQLAESVLEYLEETNGAIDAETDETLEETLDELSEMVFDLLEEIGIVLNEDDEFEYEDDFEDNDEEEFDDEIEDEDDDEEGEYDEDIERIAGSLDEARGGKTQKRPKRGKRMLLSPKSARPVKGKSKYSKNSPKTTVAQVRARKYVRNPKALLAYLRLVKSGKVAPGQPISKAMKKGRAGKGMFDKKGRYNPGAARARRAAGK